MYKISSDNISGMTEDEYKEIKQYLKTVYDIDSVFFPLTFPKTIIIK